ncbi:hypothetical protein CUN60_09760 [Aquella oligotrophica]|uniref:Uncharacterized protein n=2 Tax=Aquella oligotrophica TaxID=2067065 RepID=A0A2I7N806_9NEIS|nr:hypothetical protein CUN60_09760 [Aquella oligotrophica]
MTACSTGEHLQESNGGYQLQISQTAPVPVVNQTGTDFLVYISNRGQQNADNLNISIVDYGENGAKTSSFSLGNPEECKSIGARSTCTLLIKASAKIKMHSLALLKVSGNQYSISYPIAAYKIGHNSNQMARVSSVSEIDTSSKGSKHSFFLVNNINDNLEVKLPATDRLPSGYSYSLGICPQPLPKFGICQIILNHDGFDSEDTSDIAFEPSIVFPMMISVMNLATANTTEIESSTLFITNTPKANIILYSPNDLYFEDNLTNNYLTMGYIGNSGLASLEVKKLLLDNKNLEIVSDECTNKTIAPGQTCKYTVQAREPELLENIGNSLLSVYYADNGQNLVASTPIYWIKGAESPTPVPNIIVNKGEGINIQQSSMSKIIVITNNGNTTLTQISPLKVTVPIKGLSLVNNNCNGTLRANESCNYTLNYRMEPPSVNSSVNLGIDGANYIDNVGKIQKAVFNNPVKLNINTIFAGVIVAANDSENITLDKGQSASVVLNNIGNHDATINSITASDKNIIINNNCNGNIGAGASCNISLSAQNQPLSAMNSSGNGIITVSYNNNNGNSLNLIINVSSIPDSSQPALQFKVSPANLAAQMGQMTQTIIQIKNLANIPLFNLSSPVLPGFDLLPSQYSDDCKFSGGKILELQPAQSCRIRLAYKSAVSSNNQIITSKITGRLENGSNFNSGLFGVSLNDLDRHNLGVSRTNVNQIASWLNSKVQDAVILSNNGSSNIKSITYRTSESQIIVSGCTGGLNISSSCSLTISGNYSKEGVAVIDISYIDDAGLHIANGITVHFNYIKKPELISSLFIDAPDHIAVNTDRSASKRITLINQSTTINGADGSLFIDRSSLKPVSGSANVDYSLNTDGIKKEDACDLQQTIFTLSEGESCSYNLQISTKDQEVSLTDSLRIKTSHYIYSGTNNPLLTKSNFIITALPFIVNVVKPYAILSITGESMVGLSGQRNINTTLPFMSLKIKNIGEAATIDGLTLVGKYANNFFIQNQDGCNSIAPDSSCQLKLFLKNANALNPFSLNRELLIGYNSGRQKFIAQMSSAKQFIAAINTSNQPDLVVTGSMAGCSIGDGSTENPCYLFAGVTGLTPAILTLTFTNNASVSATNFIISADSYLLRNYKIINDCNNKTIAANGGSCSIKLITLTAGAMFKNYDLTGDNLFSSLRYSYKYDNSQSANGFVPLDYHVSMSAPLISFNSLSENSLLFVGIPNQNLVTISNYLVTDEEVLPKVTILPDSGNFNVGVNDIIHTKTGLIANLMITPDINTPIGVYTLHFSFNGLSAETKFFVQSQLQNNVMPELIEPTIATIQDNNSYQDCGDAEVHWQNMNWRNDSNAVCINWNKILGGYVGFLSNSSY